MLKAGWVSIPNFQTRVLIGTASFVGMLLLVGWISINEPSRMDVFTQQFHGRSIENGAAIFQSTCATCHGIDAKGIAGTAPGLNNPMLFLKDNPAKVQSAKVADLKTQQATLQGGIDINNQNIQTLANDNTRLKTLDAASDEAKKLQTEITSLTAQIANFDLAKQQKQIDDLTAQIKTEQAKLDDLVNTQKWDPNRDTRLTEVKWGGTLNSYLQSTITSGRPVSAGYWPQPMPAWGQMAGGPLRPDEVADLAAFIENFHDTAITLSPKDVNQQFKLPTDGGTAATGGAKINVSGKPVGMTADIKALDKAGQLKGGDATLGEAKYSALGCAGCHVAGITGPITAGTYTRIVSDRLKDPANVGKTPEEYIGESIIHPDAYVVPNFAPVMLKDFGAKLDIKDLQDLIAYLEAQK